MTQDGHFVDVFFLNNFIIVCVIFNTRTGFRLSDASDKYFFEAREKIKNTQYLSSKEKN